MKALTVCQPYAELIVRGLKPIENRTWATSYRGDLLLHAGKSREWLDPEDIADYPGMAFGAIVAIVRLVACRRAGQRGAVDAHGHRLDEVNWGKHQHLITNEHALGPWCWVMENVRRCATPVPARGEQGLWMPTPILLRDVLASIARQSASLSITGGGGGGLGSSGD